MNHSPGYEINRIEIKRKFVICGAHVGDKKLTVTRAASAKAVGNGETCSYRYPS